MALVLHPTAAEVAAQSRPYTVQLWASYEHLPRSYAWYVNGSLRKEGTDIATNGAYYVNGPTITFSNLPVTVRVDVVRDSDGVTVSDTYTTADLRPAPTTTISLVKQEDGVPITNQIQPMSPWTVGVPGENVVSLGWSYGAQGYSSRSDVIIRIHSKDVTDYIDNISLDWGDGTVETIDCNNLPEVLIDRAHTYTATSGSQTVQITPYKPDGSTGAPDAMAISLSSDVTGFLANQYRIVEYQDQLGFREISVVGWRDIEGEPQTLSLYNHRKGHAFYHMLQLRYTDVTGIPKNTSALSNPSSVGPWS